MPTPGGFITFRARLESARKVRGDAIPCPTEEEVIAAAVDMLITRLYDPNTDHEWQASSRVKEIGCDDEAINWGDLSCCDVERNADGTFTVLVEEASPDAAHLRAYLELWLQKWGWAATVQTEW